MNLPLHGQRLPPGYVWLVLEPASGLTWRYSAEMIPGCCAARYHQGRWWFAPGPFGLWHTFAVGSDPDPEAYGPAMVISGVTRPGACSNLWCSDPAQPMPQWLTLDLASARPVSCVQLTFDTDLARINRMMPAFYRAPECVRDYRLQAETAADVWTDVAVVQGNYQRLRVHRFAALTARRWRLRVDATNGSRQARVYEVRLYAP